MRRSYVPLIVACSIFTGVATMADEKVLYDFKEAEAAADWSAIHDVVMGGVSSGGVEATGEDTLLFVGEVSLENNGGFASIRSDPGKRDLGAFQGIEIRVRGDGQRYKLNLKTDAAFDGIQYRVAFQTEVGEWQTLRFPFTDFFASFRGRTVPDAPALDPSRITSFGFLISDRQAGPFRLEIDLILAYSE
jgi:monofunctional biosynthetic peptidoglycan transglycosylase